MRGLLFVLLSFACALAPRPTHAQTSEAPPGVRELHLPRGAVPRSDDFETARTVGTGLGLRAGAFGTTAVLVNPANLSLARQYHVEGFVQYVPDEAGVTFGSVVADSSTNRIRVGIASRGMLGGGDHGYRGTDNRLSLGMALADAIGIGVSLRYMRLRARHETNDGYPTALEARAITFDASLRVTPFEGLHVSAFGYNLIHTGSILAPTQLGGGVAYQLRNVLQVGADLLVDTTTFGRATVLYGGGLEWWVAEKYPIRLGYRRDEGRKVQALSFGLGYVTATYGIELSLRQELGPYRQSTLLVSARYALESPPAQ